MTPDAQRTARDDVSCMAWVFAGGAEQCHPALGARAGSSQIFIFIFILVIYLVIVLVKRDTPRV